MALTTGITEAATALISNSSEKGSKSSKDPPPRVITITSTFFSAFSCERLALTSLDDLTPCTATSCTSNSIPGQRNLVFSITSFMAALARPQIKPIFLGKNGIAFFLSGANNPSAASFCFNFSN